MKKGMDATVTVCHSRSETSRRYARRPIY
ncbi:MAG: hypothetical protein ACLUKN_11365 [Bacilli bacterium]